jgi:hypothetical protein
MCWTALRWQVVADASGTEDSMNLGELLSLVLTTGKGVSFEMAGSIFRAVLGTASVLEKEGLMMCWDPERLSHSSWLRNDQYVFLMGLER